MAENHLSVVPDEHPDLVRLRSLLLTVREKATRGGSADHAFMANVVNDLHGFRDHYPNMQVDILLEVTKYFFTRAQDAHRGLEASALAVGVARRCQLKQELRKALAFQGVLSMSVRNVRGAIESNTEALELSVELGDRTAQSAVSNNIGGVLLDTFRFEDAIMMFRFAIASSSGMRGDATKVQAGCLSNLALCYLHKGEVIPGLDAIRASIKLYGEPSNADERVRRVIAEFVYCRLLCESDDVPAARMRAALAKAYASQTESTRADLYCEFAEALCDAYDGNTDLAETRIVVGLEKARVIPSTLRDALATVIQVYKVLAKEERADYYRQEFRELVIESQKSSALDLEILQSRGMMRPEDHELRAVESHPYNVVKERILRAISRAS